MVKRVRGKRGGHSRQQLSRHREKTTVNQVLKEFRVGDRVIIDIDSSMQAAMPHPRYQGQEGTITERRGTAYVMSIMDGDKKKTVITTAVHLKAVKKAK